MGTLQSVASPTRQPYVYVPLTVHHDPRRAVQELIEMDEHASLDQLVQMVDPVAFERLADTADSILNKPSIQASAEPETIERLEMLRNQCQGGLQMTRERTKAKNDTARNGRRIHGERQQQEVQYEISRVSKREAERQRHATRLWKDCGICIDIEFSPWIRGDDKDASLMDQEAIDYHGDGGRRIDGNDVSAGRVRRARHAAGMCDYAVPLALAQRDIARSLSIIARLLVSENLHGTIAGPLRVPSMGHVNGPFATSWLREARFYAHGQLGKPANGEHAAIPAGFAFDGGMLQTDIMSRTETREAFAPVREFMAPGSSVILEGCDTGSGALGKAFMREIARCFFGEEKWGYVRANTIVTGLSPVNPQMGFQDGQPVTHKWPDDFR